MVFSDAFTSPINSTLFGTPFKGNDYFSPLDISDLKLWLDASDARTITDNGADPEAAVSQWDDKSGNGNHATASGSDRPRYGNRTMNGLPTMDFQNTHQMGITDSVDFDCDNDFTVFVVFETDAATTADPVFTKYGTSGGREWYLANTASTTGLGAYTTPDGINFDLISRGGLMTNNEQRILGFRFDNSEEVRELFYDRGTVQVTESGNIFDGAVNLSIGGSVGGSARLDGAISELLYFKRKLTDGEMDSIGMYLRDKWGVPWTTNAKTLIATSAGQSNASNAFSTTAPFNEDGKDAFITEALNYWDNVEFLEGSESGTPVMEANGGGANHWIDTDLSDGPVLTQWKTRMTSNYVNGFGTHGDPSKVKVTVWVGGEGDSGTAEASFETALEQLYSEFKDTTRTDHIVLAVIPGTFGSSQYDDHQYQRNAILDAINDLDYVYFGAEAFDIPLDDTVHFDEVGQATLNTRLAKRAAAILGKRSEVGTLGPIITSATYSGSTVTATVELDGGSAISGSEVDQFRIEDDGNPVTISSIDIDGTTLTFNLGSSIMSGSTVQLWCNYGRGEGVTQANLVKDFNGMPMRSVKELTVSEA